MTGERIWDSEGPKNELWQCHLWLETMGETLSTSLRVPFSGADVAEPSEIQGAPGEVVDAAKPHGETPT